MILHFYGNFLILFLEEDMYFKADLGYDCSTKTLVSTESDCEMAANQVGYEYKNDLTRDDRPMGCYWSHGSSNQVYFNNLLERPSDTSIGGDRGGLCKGK